MPNFLNPFDELATRISSAVYDARPVPPLVPTKAVVNVSELAVIFTATVELAVRVTAVELDTNPPDNKYASSDA
jgi:hypothetical protein